MSPAASKVALVLPTVGVGLGLGVRVGLGVGDGAKVGVSVGTGVYVGKDVLPGGGVTPIVGLFLSEMSGRNSFIISKAWFT
jgi:hypothetical protein